MSSSHVRRWLALAIVLPALIYIAALLFYPNRDWLILWPRAFDVPLPTVLIVSVCVLSYAAGALWLGQRSRISWGAVMAFVIVGGLLLQVVLTLPSEPDPLVGIARRTYAVFTGGYFSVGAPVVDVPDFLAKYAERAASYPVHQARHPPGLSLIFWLGAQLFVAWPRLAEPVANLLRSQSCLSWLSVNLPANQMAAGLFGIVVEIILAMVAIVPLAALVRRLAGMRAALWSVLLYPLIPGFGMWVSQFDRGLALIMSTALWLTERWVSERRARFAFLLGLTLSVGTFLSFGMAPVVLTAAIYAIVRIWQMRPVQSLVSWLRPIMMALSLALVGLSTVWLGMWLIFRLDPVALYHAVFTSHLGIPFPFWPFVLWHPWDPLTFIGLPLVMLALTLGWRKAAPLSAAFAITLAVLSLAHVARGETGRVWMFFAPAVVGAAAIVLVERTRRAQAVLVGLLAMQTLVMGLVLRVLGDYGYMPDQMPISTVPNSATKVDTRFGANGHITLLAYEVGPLYAGQRSNIVLYWQRMSDEAIDPAYRAFIHIAEDESDQKRIGQDDRMPVDWKYPTTCWQQHQVIADIHPLEVPLNALPGDYPIFVGFDDPVVGQRPPTFASLPAKQMHGSVLLPTKAVVHKE